MNILYRVKGVEEMDNQENIKKDNKKVEIMMLLILIIYFFVINIYVIFDENIDNNVTVSEDIILSNSNESYNQIASEISYWNLTQLIDSIDNYKYNSYTSYDGITINDNGELLEYGNIIFENDIEGKVVSFIYIPYLTEYYYFLLDDIGNVYFFRSYYSSDDELYYTDDNLKKIDVSNVEDIGTYTLYSNTGCNDSVYTQIVLKISNRNYIVSFNDIVFNSSLNIYDETLENKYLEDDAIVFPTCSSRDKRVKLNVGLNRSVNIQIEDTSNTDEAREIINSIELETVIYFINDSSKSFAYMIDTANNFIIVDEESETINYLGEVIDMELEEIDSEDNLRNNLKLVTITLDSGDVYSVKLLEN